MPDLMTHLLAPYAVGRLAGRPTAGPRPWLALFCLGAVLPDLATRAAAIAFHWHSLDVILLPLHTPLGMLVFCLGAVFVFPQQDRKKWLAWLLAGAGLHFIMDALQKTLGQGSYFWFFPFSYLRGQLGVIWPDETVGLLPYLVVLTLLAEAVVRFRIRRTG